MNPSSPLGPDPHSYANFSEAYVTHLSLHFSVDFHRRILHGYTDHTVQIHKETDHFRMDFRGCSVEQVFLVKEGKEAKTSYTVPLEHPTLGHCLQVAIPKEYQAVGSKFVVRVYSSTTDASGGIQLFEPCQTLGKKYPFMYSQFEAILARTMIPCQDTPSVKAPYDIKVTVAAPLVAACSGALVERTEQSLLVFPNENQTKFFTYHFQQKVPIPAYLIALAVGALERGQIGPRSYVWCEKEILQAAIEEYAETEKYLKAGEEICGIPYSWGTYDLLMLPGAFPYGGMENPNLTFLNSCLITGDRSLCGVVAHEITHSWAGNLVTNSNWNDFFLNEGFTKYIERLILGVCSGEEHRHFCLASGYEILQKTCQEMKDEAEFTILHQNLVGIDPDVAFSRIPYEKGCLLLFHLEVLVGGKDKMIDWLRSYFKTFFQKSLDYKQMMDHFNGHFPDVKVDWEMWMQGKGLPIWDPIPHFKEGISQKVQALANVWLKEGGKGAIGEDLKWGAEKTMLFLDHIINSGQILSAETVEKMEETYKLSASNNVEISFRWLLICLESHYLNIMSAVESFLARNGRGVYVKPIYKKLVALSSKNVITKSKAREIYEANKPFYHFVIKFYVEGLLKNLE